MDEKKLVNGHNVDPVVEAKLIQLGFTVSEYLDLTDEIMTDEEQKELRQAGVPKPPKVSDPYWTQPFELSTRHKAIINLAAMGKTISQIAAEIGMAEGSISRLIYSPLFKRKINKKQLHIFDSDVKSYMKTLMNKSYAAIEEILDPLSEAKPSVRLEAAKYVIDHVVGKATQVVEHRGSVLAEFMQKLDQEKDVTPQIMEKIAGTSDEPAYSDANVDKGVADDSAATAIKVLENSKDDMDTLVDSIIGGEFVVGKRRT